MTVVAKLLQTDSKDLFEVQLQTLFTVGTKIVADPDKSFRN